MVYTEKELREIIGGKDIDNYLNKLEYRYSVIITNNEKLYSFEDKLELKARVDIEDILKKEYLIEDDLLDSIIELIVDIHSYKESNNVEKLVDKDKLLMEMLLQKGIIISNCYKDNLQISHSLRDKILIV